jgi:hypothetical protein
MVILKKWWRFTVNKRILVMFVLTLLVLSSFVIAQNETALEDSCGFWCSVNEFLFGSSDARALAGTAWFDRTDALVGDAKSGPTIPAGQCGSGMPNFGSFCWDKGRLFKTGAFISSSGKTEWTEYTVDGDGNFKSISKKFLGDKPSDDSAFGDSGTTQSEYEYIPPVVDSVEPSGESTSGSSISSLRQWESVGHAYIRVEDTFYYIEFEDGKWMTKRTKYQDGEWGSIDREWTSELSDDVQSVSRNEPSGPFIAYDPEKFTVPTPEDQVTSVSDASLTVETAQQLNPGDKIYDLKGNEIIVVSVDPDGTIHHGADSYIAPRNLNKFSKSPIVPKKSGGSTPRTTASPTTTTIVDGTITIKIGGKTHVYTPTKLAGPDGLAVYQYADTTERYIIKKGVAYRVSPTNPKLYCLDKDCSKTRAAFGDGSGIHKSGLIGEEIKGIQVTAGGVAFTPGATGLQTSKVTDEPTVSDKSTDTDWGTTFGVEGDALKQATTEAQGTLDALTEKQSLGEARAHHDEIVMGMDRAIDSLKDEAETLPSEIRTVFEQELRSVMPDKPTSDMQLELEYARQDFDQIMEKIRAGESDQVIADRINLVVVGDEDPETPYITVELVKRMRSAVEYQKDLAQDIQDAEDDRRTYGRVDSLTTITSAEAEELLSRDYNIGYDEFATRQGLEDDASDEEILAALRKEVDAIKASTPITDEAIEQAQIALAGTKPNIPTTVDACKKSTTCVVQEQIINGEKQSVMYITHTGKVFQATPDAEGAYTIQGALKGVDVPDGARIDPSKSMDSLSFGAITYTSTTDGEEETFTVVSDKKADDVATEPVKLLYSIYKQLEVKSTDTVVIDKDGALTVTTTVDGKPTNPRMAETIYHEDGQTVVSYHLALSVPVEGKKGVTQFQRIVTDSSGRKLHTQTEEQEKDGKVSSGGQEFAVQDGFDSESGICTTGKACLKGTDGRFKGRSIMAAGNNPMDKVPAILTISGCGNSGCSQCGSSATFTGKAACSIPSGSDITETWSYTREDGVKVDYEKTCTGGECTEDNFKGDVYDTDQFYGAEFRTTTSGTGDDKRISREYNSETVGIFSYVDKGKGYGADCIDSRDCGGNTVFFSPDGYYACPTDPCKDTTDDRVETKTEGWESRLCGSKGDDCKKAAKDGRRDQETGLLLAGRTDWQSGLGDVLTANQGWSSISMALLGDAYALELASDIDRWFAGTVLSVDFIESSVCYNKVGDIQDSEDGYAFIETASGTFQPVASIQAEMVKELTPLLCMVAEDVEGNTEFVCPGELYCNERDQFCYEDEDAEEPKRGYQYKITWGVSAPFDEAFTPYIDENGVAVKFNVELMADEKPINLYNIPIELKNGETDSDVFIHYSDVSYEHKEVCIDWISPPLTVNRDPLQFGGTKDVGDVCFTIVTTTKGVAEIGSSSSGSSSLIRNSVSGGQVSRRTGW